RIYAKNSSGPSGYATASTTTASSGPDLNDITNFTGTISDQWAMTQDIGSSKLIDNSTSFRYLTVHPTTWLQFVSDDAHVVTRYAITSANNPPGRDPRDWTFQGSNDGVSWTTLSTLTNQMFTRRYQKRNYSFTNSTPYRYYRLNVLANGSGGADGV